MGERSVIETAGLRKSYDGVEALRGLDMQVPAGSICGFLGRNGSGKTTTMKILLGMARPSQGTARVFGADPSAAAPGAAIRARIGFVSDDKDLLDSMTVDELIRFTASFFPKWRRDLEARYMSAFALTRQPRVKDLSRGTRTKLALLLALSRGADLLMLDEPTANLDPAVTESVLQALVAHTAAEGATVLFSTHHITEVEQIADHLVLIEQGRAVLAGGLDGIRARHQRVQLVFDGPAPDAPFQIPGVLSVRREGRVITILSSQGAEAVVAAAAALRPASVDVAPATLKDVFLDTVKENDHALA